MSTEEKILVNENEGENGDKKNLGKPKTFDLFLMIIIILAIIGFGAYYTYYEYNRMNEANAKK